MGILKTNVWYCSICKQNLIMKSIENLKNIENKNVILRLDLNVPIKNGKVTDTNRIDKILPTLNFLLKKKQKLS